MFFHQRAIIPLYKNKGDPTDSNNYRGVTLLSCAGKLFTSIMNDRLNQYSEAHSLINETQAGFRHEYSTLDHVFLPKCIVDLLKRKKRKLFCLFVDYKKAFATIWRKGSWWKLVRDNVNGKLMKVVHSMYNNIKSCVMVNQEMSGTFMCNMGVRRRNFVTTAVRSLCYVSDIKEKLIE